MLLNNPKTISVDTSGDATFLHEDAVVRRVVEKVTPPTIYAANKELIDGFSKTLLNYSPVSINVLDYWNKTQLQQFVQPLKDSDFDTIPDSKIYDDGTTKGYWVSSIINLQEKLAQTYLNDFYSVTETMKNSHTLRQKLYQLFDSFQLDPHEKSLLFTNLNELFEEDRFITNKDYNTKKGKTITLKYAAKAAHDAEIEGALTAQSFFVDYIENDVFDYTIEGSLLPDIYNSFVKPLAHPLGLNTNYLKICKNELSDRVFNKQHWIASGVSVKCSFESDTSPIAYTNDSDEYVGAPPVLLPYIANPDYVDAETTPDESLWIPDLPYESAVQNTEIIVTDETVRGPWDPAVNHIPEIFFATEDGTGLWLNDTNSNLLAIDEGQGNILRDIQHGYGDQEYAGMNYTKYIFENGNYLIEYKCQQTGGTINKVERIIEYYRSDIFDTSVDWNTIAEDAEIPRWAYPEIQNTNIVHGNISDVDFLPDLPIKKPWLYELDPDLLTGTGLDLGVYDTNPAQTGDFIEYTPNMHPQKIILNNKLDAQTPIDIQTQVERSKYTNFDSTDGSTRFTTIWELANADVYVNGLKLHSDEYTIDGKDVILTETLNENDWMEVIENGAGTTFINFTSTLNQQNYDLGHAPQNPTVYVAGIKLRESDFNIVGNEIQLNTPQDIGTWVQIVERTTTITTQYEIALTEQNEFELDNEPTYMQVFVNGLKLRYTDYVITDAEYKNTRIILNDPVDEGGVVNIVTHTQIMDSAIFLSTAAQQIYNVEFDANNSSVYLNGVKLHPSEFTVLLDHTIQLVEEPEAGVWVQIVQNPAGTLIQEFTSECNLSDYDLNQDVSIDDLRVFVDDVFVDNTGYTEYTLNGQILTFITPLFEGSSLKIYKGAVEVEVLILDVTVACNYTDYNLNKDLNVAHSSVWINGIKQNEDSYSITDEILSFIEPVDIKSTIQVYENPFGTDNQFNLSGDTLETQTEFVLGFPQFKPYHIEVFVNGIKLRADEYTYIFEYNPFLTKGSYKWDEDTNIVYTEPRFATIDSLIARFIKTRECVVNVYDLEESEELSISDEFVIERIEH